MASKLNLALKALKALKFSASKKTKALVPFLSARH